MNVESEKFRERYVVMSAVLGIRLQEALMGKGMTREDAFDAAVKRMRYAQQHRIHSVCGVRVPHIIRTCPYFWV